MNVLEFDAGIDWALQIAYNRGKLEHIKGAKLYTRIEKMRLSKDVIVGDIANDRMFVMLDRQSSEKRAKKTGMKEFASLMK